MLFVFFFSSASTHAFSVFLRLYETESDCLTVEFDFDLILAHGSCSFLFEFERVIRLALVFLALF